MIREEGGRYVVSWSELIVTMATDLMTYARERQQFKYGDIYRDRRGTGIASGSGKRLYEPLMNLTDKTRCVIYQTEKQEHRYTHTEK